MKRILLLNYEFPPLGGGASPVSYEIAERLSATGDFDIDAVTMGYKGLATYEEVNPHFRIHRVKCLRSKKELCHPWEQLTYLVTGYFKAKELLKKGKYDVCHCHFIIPTGVIALQLKKEFGLPYVITPHGSDVPGFNTDRFKFLHKFTGPALKAIVKNAKKIACPSNYLKGLILKNIDPSFESLIEVIPNGIDTNNLTPKEKNKWIFSSGRLLPRKGFQYLIQAVSDEDIGYEVHIAGDGPMMGELKALAERSKTRIVLHGWLNNKGQEYKDLMERSAIYVLASEKENASIVLLEAMSAGCAMITTNVSGCPETVGVAGLLVNPRDKNDLIDRIKILVNKPSLLEKAQTDSAERARKVFDWSVTLNSYRRVL